MNAPQEEVALLHIEERGRDKPFNRYTCMARSDKTHGVNLPVRHVEVVPLELIAESLALGPQHEMQQFLEQGAGRVPFQSIIHVPEFCCLSSKFAERRSILTYEVLLLQALSIPICH